MRFKEEFTVEWHISILFVSLFFNTISAFSVRKRELSLFDPVELSSAHCFSFFKWVLFNYAFLSFPRHQSIFPFIDELI
jgi:hypothetical protein